MAISKFTDFSSSSCGTVVTVSEAVSDDDVVVLLFVSSGSSSVTVTVDVGSVVASTVTIQIFQFCTNYRRSYNDVSEPNSIYMVAKKKRVRYITRAVLFVDVHVLFGHPVQ